MDTNLIKTLIGIAKKQIDVAQQFKKPRITEIQKSEDIYANKTKKQLKNRFNIPLPVLPGFVDTLKSKIDDMPTVAFTGTGEEDFKVSNMVTSLWENESGDDKGRWGFTDRQAKMLAIFSGRGIYKYYAESDPKYKSNLEVIDYYDFLCEPQGGASLENHLFCGQQNIFKTADDITSGVKSELYLNSALQLLRNQSEAEGVKNQEEADVKFNRFKALNLDAQSNNYIGETLFNLVEWYITYKGTRYYLLFEPKTNIAVRAKELKDMFIDSLYPYASWATHEDPFNFWSKAPVDDIRPISEAMRVIFNQALDNVQKRNWGMRAYDTGVFPDPEKLQWRPDGLVPTTKDPRTGVYEFETPDNTQIVVNLTQYLDNFIGQKSGITAGAQGASDKDAKVGVYYGDMQQVADRLGLYNKAYKETWAQLGKRYCFGLKEHLNQPTAVKIIGNKGTEWADLKKSDIGDMDTKVSGGNAELQLNEIKKERQSKAIEMLSVNEGLAGMLNGKWLLENILRNGEFEEDEIKRAMDIEMEGNAELMSEAAQSIQDLLANKKVKINRGATTGFMQKIIDFAYNTNTLKPDQYGRLIEYAMAHLQIADDNKRRKMIEMQQAMQPQIPEQGQQQGQPVPRPVPANTQAGTASRSQNMSNIAQPAI